MFKSISLLDTNPVKRVNNYSIADTCFIDKLYNVPSLNAHGGVSNAILAGAIASFYYRKNSNVAHNLAAYCYFYFGFGSVLVIDKRRRGEDGLRIIADEINKKFPQLNFLSRYYKNTMFYIKNSNIITLK